MIGNVVFFLLFGLGIRFVLSFVKNKDLWWVINAGSGFYILLIGTGIILTFLTYEDTI